ncbi:hypothetical protein GJAV_G00079780 [Gymnothorax javanicus]|nr:hypothetical protein GJAV_G00079780 [Gymnothorax javanicus]
MVATRRGVRTSSPNTGNNEPSTCTEATPDNRRTKRRTVKEAFPQSKLTSNLPLKGEEGSTSASPESSSTVKRKPRSSKRQARSEDVPDSTHEADVSESESCCSVVSDRQAPADALGTRRTRGHTWTLQTPGSEKEQDVLSEAESCCSSVSTHQESNTGRAARSRQRDEPMDSKPTKCANADNENSEVESCGSVVSGSRVLTRSQKRMTLSRASSKSRTEDTELSEVESCSSSVSGLPQSAVRRSARSSKGRAIQPVPMHLKEGGSPVLRRSVRGSRAKLEAASEPQSHDSDGFESGPSRTPRRSTRSQAASMHQGRLILSDSESEATDVYSSIGSPSSIKGKGTPCSSRTGSGSSIKATSVPQMAKKALNVLCELDDSDFSASSHPSVSELPKNQEAMLCESGTADRPVDATCQSKTVTMSEGAGAIVSDSHAGLESTLMEEVSEEDKTLIAEEEEQVTVETVTLESKVGKQMVQEAAIENVTIGRSSEVEEMVNEEKSMEVDLSVAREPKLMEENQLSERRTDRNETIAPGMLEENTNKGDKLCMTDDVAPPSPVKVTVSVAAFSEKKEVGDVASEVDCSVATVNHSLHGVSEIDDHLAEEGKVVGKGVAEKTESDLAQKAGSGLILLDTSDEEDENSDNEHSEGESGDEQGCKGFDGDGEMTCTNESLAGPSKSKETTWLNDGLFVIDTQPGFHSDGNYYLDQEKVGEDEGGEREECSDMEDEQEEEFVDEEGDDDDDADDAILFKSKNKDLVELSSSIDPGLRVRDIGGLYISVDGIKSKGASTALKKLREQKDQDGVMQRSIIGPDFEKKESVPPYKESKQAMKLKRKEEREKTTGGGWFNMKAPEMTEELTNDLKVLKMRATMDPKRFYKKNDREGFPKYFQVGTVVDNPADFYHSRIPKKQRKRTMVEELLADAEFRNYNKKKYKQIMTEKSAFAAGKKNRKKNKFHKKHGT